MFDTKTWWQSRTIWLQLVAVLFAVLGPLGLLPHGLDQEDVISIIMAIVGIVTIVLRVCQTHAIAKPTAGVVADAAGKILAIGVSIALPVTMFGGLSACATTGSLTSTTATLERIDAIADRYASAKAFADIFLPFVSPDRATSIRLAGALVDRALAAARAAATTAQREAAIREAATAAANFRTIAGA
ncbi:hypothetical protein [Sphingomonas sp. Leaf198]|uniref:hypothetical protein n=1 Tax=Sphingomonas sp. Leaf198 TaxID=1736299 RepID=UPI0006FEB7A7|nr:hypothetical protein [Sphingomonas sp. Leaf198]KQS50977.1 hypothetical protein ASG20_02490 [Sphingomonas sp. Leaf198]